MKITLKLYATLSDYLPDRAVRNAVQIDVPDDASLNWVIDRYRLPRDLVHLVLVNGVFSHQHERDEASLRDGDTLAIWPPVAGG
jgi:molybdopterin converting factor small subunit